MIIGFPHQPPKIGGPGTFQTYLCHSFQKRGYQIVYPETNILPDVVLVVGGTRKLDWLWKCKKRGSKIVFRLDGLRWDHRILSSKMSLNYWRYESINLLLYMIRQHLSDTIVYQSEFIQNWWQFRYGSSKKQEFIIYNATDLKQFYPSNQADTALTLLCVEGTIPDNQMSRDIFAHVPQTLIQSGLYQQFKLYGHASPKLLNLIKNIDSINYQGTVSRSDIPQVMRCHGIFLPLEPHPPCPNAVIEALASGLAVVGFNTGSLKELVSDQAGMLIPYGGDAWAIDPPDVEGLICALKKIAPICCQYQLEARKLAEKRFDREMMTEQYIKVIHKTISS